MKMGDKRDWEGRKNIIKYNKAYCIRKFKRKLKRKRQYSGNIKVFL